MKEMSSARLVLGYELAEPAAPQPGVVWPEVGSCRCACAPNTIRVLRTCLTNGHMSNDQQRIKQSRTPPQSSKIQASQHGGQQLSCRFGPGHRHRCSDWTTFDQTSTARLLYIVVRTTASGRSRRRHQDPFGGRFLSLYLLQLQ